MTEAKRALLMGITGQDSYIWQSCLDKGDEIHGVIRPSLTP
jgi:GDP-D-mannose dehydratase